MQLLLSFFLLLKPDWPCALFWPIECNRNYSPAPCKQAWPVCWRMRDMGRMAPATTAIRAEGPGTGASAEPTQTRRTTQLTHRIIRNNWNLCCLSHLVLKCFFYPVKTNASTGDLAKRELISRKLDLISRKLRRIPFVTLWLTLNIAGSRARLQMEVYIL